jgi:hypothetical protein
LAPYFAHNFAMQIWPPICALNPAKIWECQRAGSVGLNCTTPPPILYHGGMAQMSEHLNQHDHDDYTEDDRWDWDRNDDSQYCAHGTFIGSSWGPDILCHWCESGVSVDEYIADQICSWIQNRHHDLYVEYLSNPELWDYWGDFRGDLSDDERRDALVQFKAKVSRWATRNSMIEAQETFGDLNMEKYHAHYPNLEVQS